MSVRSRWIVALCVAIPTALVGLVAYWFLSYDGRQDIDLGQWIGQRTAWDRTMMPEPRWATEELCGEDLPCIQAVTSDRLTLFRFERREDAVAAAGRFGDDGYLTGWIAVRYEPDGLTDAQRTEFEDGISCINAWVGEAGQDC